MVTEPRLTAGFWVAAYLARLQLAAIPVFVTRRGDETAGAVLVKCATLDGNAVLWRREWDLMTDRREWRRISVGPEPEVDALTQREAGRDPDLWLIEVEDRQGRTLLDEPGL